MVETAAVDDDDAAAVAVLAAAYYTAAPAVIPSCCPCGYLCGTTAHCSVAVALPRMRIKNTPRRSWIRSLAALAAAVVAAADGALAARAAAVETFAAASCLSPCCYPNAAACCWIEALQLQRSCPLLPVAARGSQLL